MAIVVEDGTGVAGAETFISVTDADTYHINRTATAWTDATTEAKESALRKSKDYLEGKYRLRWKGTRATQGQPLSWPRTGVYDQDGYLIASTTIPQALKDAQAEAALRALSADLQPDLERGGAVKREKVDVIEVEYFGAAAGETLRPTVDRLLLGLIRSKNELVRA